MMTRETTLITILVRDGLDPEDRPSIEGPDQSLTFCDTLYEAIGLLSLGGHRPTVLIVSAWTWFKTYGVLGSIALRQGVRVICWMKHSWDVTRLLKISPVGIQPDAMVHTEQQLSTVLQRIKTEQILAQGESSTVSTITLDHCEISTQERNALLIQEPDKAGVIGGV